MVSSLGNYWWIADNLKDNRQSGCIPIKNFNAKNYTFACKGQGWYWFSSWFTIMKELCPDPYNPCVLSRRDSTDMKSASVSIRVLPDKGSWEHFFPESPPLTPPSAPRSPSAPTCFSSWLCSSCPPTLLPLTLKSPQMLPRRHDLSS